MPFKRYYIVIAILVIGAVVASIFLAPGSRELALMQLKDKHFEEARVEYEKELAKGSLTLEVANNLTDLYLQEGATDKAIDTMKKYVAVYPDNLEARKKLGTLYQYAQRPDDYLKNLEEINSLKPTADNLNTLSNIYSFKGDYDKEAQTLRDLIISEKGSNPDHFVGLANIQASRHDYTNAAATLYDLQKTHPDKFTFDNETLLVSVLLDNKQPDDALKAATDWLNKQDKPMEAAHLINMLHFKGSTELAEKLMGRYDDTRINTSPDLLEAWVLIQLSNGQYEVAYERLHTLYDAGRLPPALNTRLLTLAAISGNTQLTEDMLKKMAPGSLSEPETLMLLDLAVSQNNQTIIVYINDNYRDDNSRKVYPALTAALAIIDKQKNADDLIAHLNDIDIAREQQLQVADICAYYKRTACVESLLAKLPDVTQLTDSEVVSVGNIYLKLHELEKGRDYLAEATKNRNSPAIEQLAVVFSAALGDTNAVQTWIGTHPDAATPHMLTDLYYAAFNNQKTATAAAIAEIFHNKDDNSVSRSLLASAYVKEGRYGDAIALLHQNNPMSADDENNYLVCLIKLAPHSKEYHQELANYAKQKLNSDISEQKKMDLVYALIGAGETETAMPYIHDLALHSGGQWTPVYAQILDKEGHYDQSQAFWVEIAKQPGTSAKQKEDIAYTLLDRGDKADAEAIFMQLADKSKPDGTPVAELLYIWGPRPEPAQMKWLESRYSTSTADEQQQWLKIISYHATSDYLIAFVKRYPESLRNKEITDTYFEALSEKGQINGKCEHYIAEAKVSKNTALLKECAEAAQANGYARESGKAYKAIADIEPQNFVALREAGVAAFNQADYVGGKHYLGLYTQGYKPETVSDKEAYLAFFYYAEMLRKDHLMEEAKANYRKTLSLMNNAPDTASNLSIKAQSQIWSGDEAGGTKTFDNAVAEYPKDKDLNTAYVETMMEIHQYDKARTVLKSSPQAVSHGKLATGQLPAFATPVQKVLLLENNHELLVYFSKQLQEADLAKSKTMGWASYTGDGYDTLLLTASSGYKFEVASLNSGNSSNAKIEHTAANVPSQGAPKP